MVYSKARERKSKGIDVKVKKMKKGKQVFVKKIETAAKGN